MTATETGRSLLNAILDAPDDDMHRMVYADWLEEQGQTERAEFIRVQLEYENCTEVDKGCAFIKDNYQQSRWWVGVCICKGCVIARRVMSIRVLSDWLPDCGGKLCQWWLLRKQGPTERPFEFVFRRGFIDEVRCPLDDWLTHMAQIMYQHPVRKVVTEKKPSRARHPGDDYGFGWRCGSIYDDQPDSFGIPPHIWSVMTGRPEDTEDYWEFYETEQLALDALSAALVQMGYDAARKLTEE